MKILFLASGNVKSNFSYRIMALARGLHRLGHDVVVIAPKADKYNNFIPEKIDMMDDVKILQPFQFATRRVELNLFPYMFSAAAMVLREKPDLVYIYKPTPITIVGLTAKFFRDIPVVLDMDDLGSEVMKIEGHPWHQRVLVEWCERSASRYADRIVVASHFLYRKYRRAFPEKPIHIMPNGVESDWLAPPIASEMPRRIVFMGSMNRESILAPLFDVLPTLIKRYPDMRVVMIGDGRYLPHFKTISRTSGVEENIHFTGWLPLHKTRTHMRSGDIGYGYMPADPTTQAASFMKIPQYMSRGVVPIVSNVGDLPITVDFGAAGYIARADDVASLQATLISALADADRPTKAAHARALAEERLHWDILSRAFEQWNNTYTVR